MQFVNRTKSNVKRNGNIKKWTEIITSESRMKIALNYCFVHGLIDSTNCEIRNVIGSMEKRVENFVFKVYNGDFSSPQFE